MRTHPLLCCIHHRAMALPVGPLHTGLIHPELLDNLFVWNYSQMGTVNWIGIQI